MCKSYICMYVYIYTCVCVITLQVIHAQRYPCIQNTCVYTCIYIHIHIHILSYIYNICVYIRVNIYIYGVHVDMWPHIYIYIYIYIYMHVFLLVLFSVPCGKVPRAPSAWCASRSWRSGRAQGLHAIKDQQRMASTNHSSHDIP